MYPFVMALRLEDLPSDAARLIEMVLSLDAENDRLRAVIHTFKDMVFGSRSEKLAVVVADQLALDLADLATDVTLPAAANDDHVPSKPAGTTSKPRKKAQRNIGALPKHLPRCEQVIEPERPPYTIREGGSRLCFVRDPDGYRIEILERT